jgi:short-subunit dehydrogenase
MNIVITGASNGLGAELAARYAAPGVTLGLTGRDSARLETVAAICRRAGAAVVVAALDVSDAAAMGDWLGDFDARHPVDLVIANAGISLGTAADGTLEGLAAFTRLVEINLLGAANTIEPLIPAMIRRGSGRIALIASIASLRGLPYSPGYSASKAGLRTYGEALRAALRPKGIAVTVISPGFFDTAMTRQFRGGTPFLISVERAAEITKLSIDKRQARLIFPFLLGLGVRLTDLLPAWLGDMILRNFRFHIAPREVREHAPAGEHP